MAKRGNPYHDAKGLFSTASGDADGKPSGGRSADEVKQRAANNGLTDAEYKAKYGMTPAQFKAKLAKAAKVGPVRGKDYKNDVHGQERSKNEQAKALAAKFENKPFVHPDMNKPASTTSGRFHITRNGVMIDLKNPAAGIASNLRMELGQRGMIKRRYPYR